MANFDSPADIKVFVLSMADMQASGDDFDTEVGNAIVMAKNDLDNRHPWYWRLIYPPGVFLTVADITTLTLTIAAAGASAAATLSATYTPSLVGYKIRPTGKSWIARITAHTAATATLTLDAAPEAVTAGTACTIFQDEIQLASDLGLFKDGLWRQDGSFIEMWDLEYLVNRYPDPPVPGDTPEAFARLDRRRIRLSHYPTDVRRYEYPYAAEEADLDVTSSTALTIPQNWRWVLAHGALYYALLMKSDKRAGLWGKSFEEGIGKLYAYHEKALRGLGRMSRTPEAVPYGT